MGVVGGQGDHEAGEVNGSPSRQQSRRIGHEALKSAWHWMGRRGLVKGEVSLGWGLGWVGEGEEGVGEEGGLVQDDQTHPLLSSGPPDREHVC